MTLFEYGKSVLEAWDNFIEALLDNSPIGRFAKRIVKRSRYEKKRGQINE